MIESVSKPRQSVFYADDLGKRSVRGGVEEDSRSLGIASRSTRAAVSNIAATLPSRRRASRLPANF